MYCNINHNSSTNQPNVLIVIVIARYIMHNLILQTLSFQIYLVYYFLILLLELDLIKLINKLRKNQYEIKNIYMKIV